MSNDRGGAPVEDDRDEWDRLPVDPDLEPADLAGVDGDADLGPSVEECGRPGHGDREPGRRGRDPRVIAAIALGAMPGASARYALSRLLPTPAGAFPWATFWTNVSGAFVLGVLLVLLLERFPPTRYTRAFAATGFLGAYTTFSTFSVETDVLAKDGHEVTALVYVAASLVVGLAAAWAGVTGTRLLGRRGRSNAPLRAA